MAWRGIIGERFTPDEFAKYVAGLKMGGWRPQFVTLHNTAIPSLKQRPKGLTHAHILGLQSYYRDKLSWSGSPHLFVDQNGIWVFNPLTLRGTHSPGFNALSWGVEMLGNYEKEPFNSGPGALVRDNAVAAVAILDMKCGFQSGSLRLHKEDPLTTHECPGRNVHKGVFIEMVHDEIVRRRADGVE